MKEFVYKGIAWKCLDDVHLYSIIPKKYTFMDVSANVDELKKHVMEDLDPNFSKEALQGKYEFIVAGKNFGGGGKSLEHPVFAIKGAGINVVVADSFSRYFFRNSINNGLPVLVCKGITNFVDTGDKLEINLITGKINNITKNKSINASPLPSFILDIISEGGYINYISKKLDRTV